MEFPSRFWFAVPLFAVVLVVVLEVFIARRAKRMPVQLLLPAVLAATSVYCLLFWRQERPTMAPGMYGTFFLALSLVSLVTLGVVWLAAGRRRQHPPYSE